MPEEEKRAVRIKLRQQISKKQSAERVANELADHATAQERKRAAAMFGVAKQAKRLGVAFDFQDAIRKRMSVKAARDFVLSTAVDKQAAHTSTVASSSAHRAKKDGGAITPKSSAELWRVAFQKNRPSPMRGY